VIWAILAFLGVPLWIIALALVALYLRNRALRNRPGDIAVRVLRPGKRRWTRAHALWVSDVLAWRGSPAAWREDLVQVRSVYLHAPDAEQQKKLHGLGDDPVLASLSLTGGSSLEVAARHEHRAALLGPFGETTEGA
jgi:hypothetical protein